MSGAIGRAFGQLEKLTAAKIHPSVRRGQLSIELDDVVHEVFRFEKVGQAITCRVTLVSLVSGLTREALSNIANDVTTRFQ